MSQSDHIKYSARLKTLLKRKCFVQIVTNSLKIHIDKNKRNGIYIWIDPPWQFGIDDELIVASLDCPSWQEVKYSERFARWAELLSPIRKTILVDALSTKTGDLRLYFSEGYRIVTVKNPEPDARTLWYEQWYISDKQTKKGNHYSNRESLPEGSEGNA